MAVWNITYNGVTKSAAQWGIVALVRKRKSAATGMLTFKMSGLAIDATPPFAQWQPLTLTRTFGGVTTTWFQGWVTKMPVKGSPKAEDQFYEVSDAWYWLEQTIFQQQWLTADQTGTGETTVTTTRSDTILGQSFQSLATAVKINSGQVMMEVLLYAQYAYQLIPYPTTVNVETGLPAPPATALPFQIGALTPSIVIPYMQVRDKSCADILKLMLKFSPDAIAWIDYTTSPVTLNISQRSAIGTTNLKTISVLGGTVTSQFSPTPRYDLQVPVVVAKFEEKITVNGTVYDNLTVDSYPPAPAGVDQGAWESQPRAWVQTIDLVGGNTTSQFAYPVVVARPTTAASEVAMSWILYKNPWLGKTVPVGEEGTFPFLPYLNYDVANMTVSAVTTTIDPNDPLNKPNQNPNAITLPGLPQLVNELISGDYQSWLQQAPNEIDCAKALVEVDLVYSGSDPNTQALFWYNPANPGTPLTDGSGVLRLPMNCKVTNAESQTYSQLTSWSASEPVPTGYAEYLYNCLAQLHFDGDLTLTELECSDLLPIGCIFNTSDGIAAWKSMNALVLAVTEDIDSGTTSVQFGPPLNLGLGDLAELFRARLGILPSYKLQQRTSGKLTAGSNVIGQTHAPDTSSIPAPGGPSQTKSLPWAVTLIAPVAPSTQWQAKVNPNSYLMATQQQGDVVPLTGGTPLGQPFNINPNGGPYDGDIVYVEVPVTGLEPGIGQVTSGSVGGTFSPALPAWDASGDAYVANDGASPPNQTFFRVLLATIAPQVGSAPPVVTATCTQNLLIFNTIIGSEAAIMAYPTNTGTPA